MSLRRRLPARGTWTPRAVINVQADSPASPAEQEVRAEAALLAGTGDIYGIPRSEWLALQSPARYLGNEFGAVHKPWGSTEIRFALTYPEIYEVGASNLVGGLPPCLLRLLPCHHPPGRAVWWQDLR